MGDNSVKNSSSKNPEPRAHLHIIGRKSTKFSMNLMKDIEGVSETRLWLAKFKSALAITLSTRLWLAKFKSALAITLSKIVE